MAHRVSSGSSSRSGARLTRRRALVTSGASLAVAAAAAGGPGRLSAQEATPETSSAPPMELHGEVTAERAALAADRAREYAPQLLAETGMPGLAVAIVYNDKVLLAAGFGVRELGKDEPIEPDTVFQLASLSKSVASTVVASVVGDGEITWQSRMADLDPAFALSEAWPTQNVTLADLFSHRSSLRDHAGDLLEDMGYPQADIIHRLRYLPPAYSFRAGYKYTNYGLTAAALAAAMSTGTGWDELSEQRLYQPLHMMNTSSRFADYMAAENRAVPHIRVGDSWVVTPMQRDPDPQTPAGGVSSTINDFTQWIRLILGTGTIDGDELIPASALTPVHIPQSMSNVVTDPAHQRQSFYGLGTGVSYTNFGTPQWSHSGAFALGAGTAYYLLPASNFGVVAFGNGMPIGVPEALCLDVLDIAQTGQVSRDWMATVGPSFEALMAPIYGSGTDWGTPPSSVTPAQPNDAYVGVYENDVYGEVTVMETGDGLAFQIGPRPMEFELVHYDRDTFSWQPIGENAGPRSALSFTLGPNGAAVSFDDEYLAAGGDGTLRRLEADE